MGILANSVSICHFRVAGDLPAGDLFPWLSECLARQGFRSIETGLEELSIGWVQLDDRRSADFSTPAAFWRDHYAVFSLRRDQRKIPAALFKAYLAEREEEFLMANPGFNRVPKQRREEFKELVRSALLAKTLPVPIVFDAVWDTRTGIVTFATLGSKNIEQLDTLFRKSFPGLRTVALHPFARAAMIAAEELQPALTSANRASNDSVLEQIRANQWLGQDFLLWLLYGSIEGSGEYRVSSAGPAEKGETFSAYLNDRLILQSIGDAGPQKVTVSGAQDRFREVLAALRQGKRITEATIHLERGSDSWKLTLKGEVFHFASFKAPPVQMERDNTVDAVIEREGLFFERMHLMETGLQLFDSLFAAFLAARLSGGWSAYEQRIAAWLAEG